ncbi:MAG: SAM-dependent methyltransferase, partial [Saprospiraceae bacterium]
LEDEEVDAIVVVNTYVYIENRISYFNKLMPALKSGGKLLVVDYKSQDLPEGYGPPKDTRASKSDVINELEEAGYRLQEVDDSTLEYQYIILVMKP